MDGSITVHVVEPGSNSTVPNTGLFLGGSGGTLLLSAILVLVILVQVPILIYTKKRGKSIRLSRFFTTKASVIPVLISLFALTALVVTNINAADSDENGSLITVENADLTIELGDEPAFAYVPVSIKFKEATSAGYSISSYAKTSKLTREGSDEAISLIAAADEPSPLTDNTWGFALTEPNSEKDETFIALPETEEDALVIKSTGYKKTSAGDETIVYYGIYVTPDLPYGTYSGLVIDYEAEENAASIVRFDGNGLYFDDNEEQVTNDVMYITNITDNTEKYSHAPNINDDGEASGIVGYHNNDILNNVVTIPGASKINIKLSYGGGYISGGYPAGFVSFWQGKHSDYTTGNNIATAVKTCGSSDVTDGKFYGNSSDQNAIITTECELEGDSVTFAYWTQGGGPSQGAIYGFYAVVTGYDADGNAIYLPANAAIDGDYKDPAQDLPYVFVGWNDDKNATTAIYSSAEDIEKNLSLVPGETTTLYAIWEHATDITFDGNGADTGAGKPGIRIIAGQRMSLYNYDNEGQIAYSRTGYSFTGWNTKADGSGEFYLEYPGFTASTDKSENVLLYAQWTDCGSGRVCYNANNSTTDEKDLKMQSSNAEYTLVASNYRYDTDGDSHNDKGFIGWSEDPDAAAKLMDADPDNNAIIYGPNQTITTGDLSAAGMNLYATWISPAEDKDGNILSFQTDDLLNVQLSDTEGDTLANKDTGYVTALKDSRDNEVYAVAKLADGNYWMIENLRLNSTAELTTSNTNNPAVENDTVAIRNNDGNNYNHLSLTNDDWCPDENNKNCNDQSYLNSNNLTNLNPRGNHGDDIYAYGNYYNWYSATAGQGVYEKKFSSVVGDICPAGWQLPLGDYTRENGSFSNLDIALGGTGKRHWVTSNPWSEFPNNFVYSGHWLESLTNERGYVGYYWSSSSSETNYVYQQGNFAYSLSLAEDFVEPGSTREHRHNGNSVRCVAPVQTTIVFNGNGNTGGETPKQNIKPNTTKTINQNSFTKDGYKFVGWNTAKDGSGTSYTNGQEYSAGSGSVRITLYAQWEAVTGCMQDVETWGSSLSIDEETTVTDCRDGKEYTVARLADNNIWMTQNLDFDIVNGGIGLDYTNTDVPQNWTNAGGLNNTGKNTLWDTWNSTSTNSASFDLGEVYWDGTIVYSQEICEAYGGEWRDFYCYNNTMPTTTTVNNHYSLGNFYNWTAAVAIHDSTTYSSNKDANQSICPSGWRIPPYSGNKSFQNLMSAAGLTAGPTGNIHNSPAYLVYGGSWQGDYYSAAGRVTYWTSESKNKDYARALDGVANDGYIHTETPRSLGNFVRCVNR